MGKCRVNTGMKLLEEGINVNIYSFINERGVDVPDEYISNLDEKEQIKLTRLFLFMLERGRVQNKEKFRDLKSSNGIFEFKSNSHRILCFILGGMRPKSFILTHGFKKEKGKTPKKEIDRAEQIKKILLELDNQNKLSVYNEETQ